MSLYLDYNASAPILPDVLDVMVDSYRNVFGNADSRTHSYGTKAAKLVQDSRYTIASVLGVDFAEVIFTAGSTESNNTCILGIEDYAVKTGKRHIITTAIEHKSVLGPLHYLESKGFQVDYVKPNESGRIDAGKLLSLIRDDVVMVSVMFVNSETGIIQPVDEIGKALKEKKILFHVDATQAFGKLNNEIRNLDYNMMSLAAHKIGGPQGIGALILKRDKEYKRPPITPLMYGGQQERGFRPGTTPVALVAGFAKAAELCEKNMAENTRKCVAVKEDFFRAVKGLPYVINGSPKYCLPSTVNISIDGLDAEAAFLCLGDSYSFTNGSACNSSTHTLSYVLEAMGFDEKRQSEAIRLSWNGSENIDFTEFAEIVRAVI